MHVSNVFIYLLLHSLVKPRSSFPDLITIYLIFRQQLWFIHVSPWDHDHFDTSSLYISCIFVSHFLAKTSPRLLQSIFLEFGYGALRFITALKKQLVSPAERRVYNFTYECARD